MSDTGPSWSSCFVSYQKSVLLKLSLMVYIWLWLLFHYFFNMHTRWVLWIVRCNLSYLKFCKNMTELLIMSFFYSLKSLFDLQNLCCAYSKESSHWDDYFEYPQHRFYWVLTDISWKDSPVYSSLSSPLIWSWYRKKNQKEKYNFRLLLWAKCH